MLKKVYHHIKENLVVQAMGKEEFTLLELIPKRKRFTGYSPESLYSAQENATRSLV